MRTAVSMIWIWLLGATTFVAEAGLGEPCSKEGNGLPPASPATGHPANSLIKAPKRGLGVGLKWYKSTGKLCRLLETFATVKPWFMNWEANDCPLCDSDGSDYEKCVFNYDSGFVPTIFHMGSVQHPLILGDAALGFNEPNNGDGAITPAAAAKAWPEIQQKAKDIGIPRLGSPAPGGSGTFKWLDEFFIACRGCKVDFVTAHIFKSKVLGANSLQSMLLALHEQYGLPIWLTEFNSGGVPNNATMAVQMSYMEGSLNLLESLDFVERYSWYALCNSIMPNAALLDCDTMELTDLGLFYRDFKSTSMLQEEKDEEEEKEEEKKKADEKWEKEHQ